MDLLLTRYSNIDFVLELDVADGINLISKAFEERNEDRLYMRWIQGHDKQYTYEQFKNELITQRVDTTLTEEEIMEDVENILKEFRR